MPNPTLESLLFAKLKMEKLDLRLLHSSHSNGVHRVQATCRYGTARLKSFPSGGKKFYLPSFDIPSLHRTFSSVLRMSMAPKMPQSIRGDFVTI